MSTYIDTLFQALDTPPASCRDEKNQERFALAAMRHFGTELRTHPEQRAQIAYDTAGLLATHYSQSLDKEHPVNDILFLAGS